MALLGSALALPAIAQVPSSNAGGAAKGAQMAYVIDVGNQTGVLLGVEGLPNAAPSMTGSAKAPVGPAVGTPINTSLMLDASVGLPASFYPWVSASIDGKLTPATFGVRGVETGGRYGQAALFSNATVSYVEVPALDTRSNAPIALGVKVVGVLKMEPPGKAPTMQQVSQLATRLGATRWMASGFHVAVGKLDTSGVRRIESFSLKPGGALTLQLTGNDATAQAFGTIAPNPSGAAAKKPVLPPLLDGELQLATAQGQVLVIIPLHEVRVNGVQRQAIQDPNTGAAVVGNTITLSARQARILFAPQIGQ
jgi:hypothetical protein